MLHDYCLSTHYTSQSAACSLFPARDPLFSSLQLSQVSGCQMTEFVHFSQIGNQPNDDCFPIIAFWNLFGFPQYLNIHWFYIHTAINCWFHWHGCSSPWSNGVVDLCVVDDGDPMVMTRGGASLQCSAFHDNDHELPLHATISAHSITDNVSSCLNQRNTSLSIKRKRINHLSCGNFKWVNM